ncbi:TPA: hypothetical protein MBN28_005251 [Klebsiella variicola]|nr:hypothetical protein AB186_19240 [Klebsiella pneumoniae]KHE28572.1 hypothetical protein JG24_20340 [Klebsiella variicola]HBT4728195.1 hypothetical protein [Klebsiella variicola subsp. variicola]ALQ86056.1 hypothetical protein AQD68_18860 [Klebsiella pneumoniae]ALQ91552.1 hypothetical protein AQD73_18820 [Klebsiella pneumoniae]
MSWKTGKCYKEIKCPLDEILLRTGILNTLLTGIIPLFMLE